MPVVRKASLTRAVGNVGRWGDTDVFPYPIENHVLHDRPAEVVKSLMEITKDFDGAISRYPVYNYSTLAPVGYNGFRWATQIDPMWNTYFLGLALEVSEQIEQNRIPQERQIVFSYRLQDGGEGLFVQDSYRQFQEKTRELASRHAYVVASDISDFYSRIYHHRLENALRPLDPGANVTRQIMAILGKLSGNTSYGLPVGGPASRIFAELVLDQVDHLLDDEGDAGALLSLRGRLSFLRRRYAIRLQGHRDSFRETIQKPRTLITEE